MVLPRRRRSRRRAKRRKVRGPLFQYRPGIGGFSFSRASTANYLDSDEVLQEAASGVLRDDHWVKNENGILVRSTLLEGARTNELSDSSEYVDGSTVWQNLDDTELTLTDKTSILQGETAREFSYTGSSNSATYQPLGSLTGSPETTMVIVEHRSGTDDDRFEFGLRDETAGEWCALVRFVFSTETISLNSGAVGADQTLRADKILDPGPNGGEVWKLQVTTTPSNSGNARRVWVYPVGFTRSGSHIIHHVQHEEAPFASSPIVTGGSPVSRAADSLSFPFPYPPQAMTVYCKFVERGTVDNPTDRIFHIGSNSQGQDPRFLVLSDGGTYRVLHDDGATFTQVNAPGSPSIGDVVEIRAVLQSDGGIVIGQSLDAAAETAASNSGALLQSAWHTPRIYVGNVIGQVVSFNPYISGPIVAKGVKTMDQMRALAGV